MGGTNDEEALKYQGEVFCNIEINGIRVYRDTVGGLVINSRRVKTIGEGLHCNSYYATKRKAIRGRAIVAKQF